MPQLIYIANVSLDGFVEDADGNFDWTTPDDEVFASITDLLRSTGTFLYGRRMYQTMAVWETDPDVGARSPLWTEFARIWQAAEKIVYSTTLSDVSTGKTRLERDFRPDAVRRVKAATGRDLTVGGAGLAAQAFDARLVDECHLFVYPVVLGGGKPALPRGHRVDLELLHEHRFHSGVVHLRYRIG